MAVSWQGAKPRSKQVAKLAGWAVGILTIALLASCTPSMPKGFDSPEPAARNEAIVDAARRKDPSARADLVRMLDSDDATTRLLAITALQEIEGTTLGYDYAAAEPERDRAIDAWKARLATQKSTGPTSTGAHR
jgi:hypothetical protein